MFLMEFVGWYLFFGIIAVFGMLRRSYLDLKKEGSCDSLLEYLEFFAPEWESWLIQLASMLTMLVMVWPALLPRKEAFIFDIDTEGLW